ncbi:class I SAM-dependent methyltransferase, partial [Pantoea agglomerans]|uniref:class I SAM-dependent methyltransferase n=1 Tax=Enterobacter agglomerans TaxID=549 RepID=UPI003D29A5E0
MMSDYDAFAEAFDAHAATSAYNAHYDRPATLSMLGDVRGMTVLDAGCGPGHYAERLVERGADVVGIDASEKLIRLAQERVEQADFRVHDLESPLSWIDDDTFDRIVMALVLHHLHDPRATLSELRRVLRPNGRLVISTVHPVADWLRLGGSYFTDERLEETWQQDWRSE